MVLLPDQVQISAADVCMESPFNGLHKVADEETTETLLNLYEEMKTAVPPIMAPDGTVIRRDGYDDILYSEELYDYFLNHVVGKEEDYERKNGEPYVTLYEQWLDETYGLSKMTQFWNYVFSLDGLQTMLDIGGFFFDGCDIVNAAIYLLRGRWKEAGWSFACAAPFIGSVIMAKKGTKLVSAAGNLSTALKTEEAVTGLTLTYKVGENGTEFFTDVAPVVEEMYSTMKHSASRFATAGDMLCEDMSITVKVVDNTDEAMEILINTGNNGWNFENLLPKSSLNSRQRKLLELLSNSGDTVFIPKKSVSMNDLRQLTNVTEDEFNMFTLGGRRLIIRGYKNQIKVSPEMYNELLKGTYGKFSGHTHPGYSLEPGPADEPFLKKLGQKRSSIWGNTGEGWLPFGQNHWLTEEVRKDIRREIMRKLYETN